MVHVKRYLLLLLCCFSLHASETCFFVPPKGWEIANPDMLAPRVAVCFLGKSSAGTIPSVNLATEPVQVSLEAYVEAIRKIHTADPNSRWRDLGTFKSLLGEGRLIELETPTESGMIRMVQLVTLKEGVAYILTASAAQQEFSKHYRTFSQVLRSLQASSNLAESYPAKSSELKQLAATLTPELWESFANKIIKDFTEMGPYWQILFLKEMQAKISRSE